MIYSHSKFSNSLEHLVKANSTHWRYFDMKLTGNNALKRLFALGKIKEKEFNNINPQIKYFGLSSGFNSITSKDFIKIFQKSAKASNILLKYTINDDRLYKIGLNTHTIGIHIKKGGGIFNSPTEVKVMDSLPRLDKFRSVEQQLTNVLKETIVNPKIEFIHLNQQSENELFCLNWTMANLDAAVKNRPFPKKAEFDKILASQMNLVENNKLNPNVKTILNKDVNLL